MKNLLIITHQYYPKGGATANILELLSSLLISNGFNVTVVQTHNDSDENQIYIHDDVNVISIGKYGKGYKKKIITHFKKKEFIQLICSFFCAIHTIVTNKFEISKFLTIENFIIRKSKIACEIEKIVNDKKIDLVISVCFPFETNYLGYTVKKKTNVKWVMYMLDPFFDNCYFDIKANEKGIKIGKRIRIEKQLLEYADLAIVTGPIYESYEKNGFDDYLYKVVKLNFPNIREVEHKNNVESVEFDDEFVNCLFIGYLDRYIRNPKFVLDVFKTLNNNKIRLYIVGGVYGQFVEGFIEHYEKLLNDRLVIVQRVEKDVAFEAILNADILINVGNTVSNQLPSKVFDYISCGKPIANFYKIQNCPTLEFTQKYPLCLDIYEGDGVNEKMINQFEKFCVENKSKRIDYSIIKDIYADCTGDVVGKKFVEAIENVLRR